MRSGIIIQACSGAITSRSRLLTAMGFIRAILWTYQDFPGDEAAGKYPAYGSGGACGAESDKAAAAAG